jgi:hypothetical protein
MSLEDQFNRDDGTWISKYDAAVIGLHRKVGEYVQETTGMSIKTQCRVLNGLATLCYAPSAGCGFLASLPLAVYSVANAAGIGIDTRTALEHEFTSEKKGFGKHYHKWKNLTFAFGGVGFLYIGFQIANLNAADMPTLDQNWAWGFGFTGAGMLQQVSSWYLSQTQMPPPPKRKEKVKIGEKLQELMESWNVEPSETPI